MKSAVEVLEDNRVKVYVEVDEAEFDVDIGKAFKAIAKEVRLPGFRAGKVPRKVLEARIGIGAARDEALREAVPQYLSQAVREHDVDLIAPPEVEITDGKEGGPIEFEAICQVRPIIKVEGYKGFTIELDAIKVSDEDLTKAHEVELARDAQVVDVNRPVESGDFLTIDLTATCGGEEVPGLNTEDWSYEVGQGWISDDFDQQLIGVRAGDEVKFESTPSGTKESTDFNIRVHRVQQRTLPQLTDKWVAENIGEFSTVEEWNENLCASLREGKLFTARQDAGLKIRDAVAGLGEYELPEPLVVAEMNQRTQSTLNQLQEQGIDVEQWLQAMGQTSEAFAESMRNIAEQVVKCDLALRAIAAAEELEVTDDELENEYDRLALRYGQKVNDVRRSYERNGMVSELLTKIKKDKAYEFVVHNCEFVDTDGHPMDRGEIIGHDQDGFKTDETNETAIVAETEPSDGLGADTLAAKRTTGEND